jgi:phenylacetate-coenzyme A ligase PaaK-like adenylate-forming protein
VINNKYINILQLLKNERRSLDELINLQNIALRKLVKHAYNTITFYKKHFDKIDLNPADIQTIEDLNKIPIIDKKMMIQYSYSDLLSSDFDMDKLIPVKTAGSNGMPFLFYIDHTFDQIRKSQYLRPYLTNGKHFFDRSVSFSVYEQPIPKWFQRLGIMKNNRIFSGDDASIQLRKIQDLNPDIIQGYGSILNLLAIKILEENIHISKPRMIFTDSELLLPEMRDNIAKAFDAKLIDIYGTWETDNIAYECNHHEGYHIAIDSVIMEFLKDDINVKPGEEGEIVVTVLNNFAMPFIRYNLHDIGSYHEGYCSCGRTFPLMDTIKGRSNDYMVTKDGKKLSYFNIARFDKLAPNVHEYQIIQNGIDSFSVFVVPGISYNNEGKNIIAPTIKRYFPEAEVTVNVVSYIQREQSGKFKAFKSKVNLK